MMNYIYTLIPIALLIFAAVQGSKWNFNAATYMDKKYTNAVKGMMCGERSILTCSFGLACRVIEALDMDVSKFYHGDYYLEEEVKTMRGKGIASRKKSSI